MLVAFLALLAAPAVAASAGTVLHSWTTVEFDWPNDETKFNYTKARARSYFRRLVSWRDVQHDAHFPV